MIATLDSIAPAAEEPRSRKRAVRQRPRDPGEQASRSPDRPTPKSKDAAMSKLSVYIPVAVLKKLDVAAVILDRDKSDIVAELLAEKLSGVTYYDRNTTRPPGQTLMVTEIGSDRTAD
jgi:hypothetical protein